jgi:hypothetical protein
MKIASHELDPFEVVGLVVPLSIRFQVSIPLRNSEIARNRVTGSSGERAQKGRPTGHLNVEAG